MPKIQNNLSQFSKYSQKLISSIVESNKIRKDFLVKVIIDEDPEIIGIYRLIMKNNSENLEFSYLGYPRHLKHHEKQIIIYEPLIKEDEFRGCKIEKP